ncbi:PorV/PorQ family protein, partial [Bacteroidia bacterium]|nr:PorV/PorQ family protein [Bacteroidia bacterium]
SGWGWASVSNANGLEAMYTNIGGLAYTQNTEIIFSRTAWLMGSDININTFGFAQNLGGNGVLGVSIMSYDIGDIPITTVEQPDGGLGTYKPTFTNIAAAFSKQFTREISGGVGFKIFSEAITNVKAQGIALDAGIQYITTFKKNQKLKQEDVKFGVSLKNIGPDARYAGDGLSVKLQNPITENTSTVNQRAAKFNLPTLMNISASYDMRLDKNDETYFHRLTPAFTFTNNAFSSNQFTIGAEYGYKSLFQLRTGYAYEDGITSYETRTNAFTGIMGGFTFEVPVKKDSETTFGLDYSYRHSNPFGGSHTFGVRLNIGE